MAKVAAKAGKDQPSTAADAKVDSVLRRPAEQEYAAELEALKAHDKEPRPEGWNLSPKAVRTYILGGKAGDVPIKRWPSAATLPAVPGCRPHCHCPTRSSRPLSAS